MKPMTPEIPLAAESQSLEIGQIVAVVIARDELVMAAVGEELEALGGLAAVPVGDDDVAREAFPRALQRAVDEVVLVDGVVIRVEHVGPDARCVPWD